jgi:hypothetical protein
MKPHETNQSKTESKPAGKAPDMSNPSAGENEGEGSRTADRRYREGVRQTIESGRVAELAEEAKEALEGPEAEELRRAEAEARRRGASVPKAVPRASTPIPDRK